jgi:cyclopropane fatty-acyl-phospholipid synthase-like methyltransferase
MSHDNLEHWKNEAEMSRLKVQLLEERLKATEAALADHREDAGGLEPEMAKAQHIDLSAQLKQVEDLQAKMQRLFDLNLEALRAQGVDTRLLRAAWQSPEISSSEDHSLEKAADKLTQLYTRLIKEGEIIETATLQAQAGRIDLRPQLKEAYEAASKLQTIAVYLTKDQTPQIKAKLSDLKASLLAVKESLNDSSTIAKVKTLNEDLFTFIKDLIYQPPDWARQVVLYDPNFVSQLRQVLQRLVSEKGSALSYKDFTPYDNFHACGTKAVEEFFASCDFPPMTPILEVGAGIGGASRIIAGRFGVHIESVDYLSHFVEFSRELNQVFGLDQLINCTQADLNAPDTALGSYKCVFSIGVAQALTDEGLKHIAASVEQGGLFYCEEYCLLKPRTEISEEELGLIISDYNLPHVRFIDDFIQLFADNGLQVVSSQDCSQEWAGHYWSGAEAKLATASEEELRDFRIFVDVCPKIQRNFAGMRVHEVLNKYPLTSKRIGYEALSVNPSSLSSKRLVFRKT